MLCTFTLATVTGPLAAKLMLQQNDIVLVDLLTFTHLADAFIQSDLQLHSGNTCFFISMCSLGIEPKTFCAADAMLHH